LRSFQHYTLQVEDVSLHFIRERADAVAEASGRPPLLLLHGWPGHLMEFSKVIKPLAHPGATAPLTVPAFDVVAPSHPGYLFSSYIQSHESKICGRVQGNHSGPDGDLLIKDVARLMDKLMCSIGYATTGYVVQAGDWGSMVARQIAVLFPQPHRLLHFVLGFPSPLSENEKNGIRRAIEFQSNGSAYAQFHSTRPATLGLVMQHSPLALLAWIGEKFLAWTDEESYTHSPEDAEILASLTLWWCTGTMARSLYPYRNRPATGVSAAISRPENFIKAPTGYSNSPYELIPTPKEWVASTCNLKWHREHPDGGHFFAMEKPVRFVSDMQDCFGKLWKR
ncbi:alpha/beta-hydrolase, partial [Tilletiaria anomala UBC 951]